MGILCLSIEVCVASLMGAARLSDYARLFVPPDGRSVFGY
jgi:hypothetical protein